MRKVAFTLLLLLSLMSCRSNKEKITSVVSELEKSFQTNGFYHITFQNDTLYSDAVYSGNVESDTIQSITPVALASLTKLFTKVLVFSLADKGILNLDAPIIQYRPQFKPKFGQFVTIRNLLEMKAGLPRELDPSASLSGVLFDEVGMAGPFLDTIPDFDIDSEKEYAYAYSNLSYWLLGAVIEAVCNTNVSIAFEKYVARPLDLNESGFNNQKTLIGCTLRAGKFHCHPAEYGHRYTSGGAYSTVTDLSKLAKVLMDREHTKRSSTHMIFDDGSASFFGALPEFSNMIHMDAKNNLLIIALNNVGLEDLEVLPKLKRDVEKLVGIQVRSKPKNKVLLNPVSQLSRTHPIEAALLEWIPALESRDSKRIFEVINDYAMEGACHSAEPEWQAMAQLDTAEFQIRGFRWERNQNPGGLQVWFTSNSSATLAIMLIPNRSDTTKIQSVLFMPDDMEWMGMDF